MKRTQINTIPYIVSGSGITTRKNLLPGSAKAMNFFGKRSFSDTVYHAFACGVRQLHEPFYWEYAVNRCGIREQVYSVI